MLPLFLMGCYQHEIETFQEMCEYTNKEYVSPPLAINVSISINDEAVMDDYVNYLNKSHMEEVNNRIEKMAWREGRDLHLVNFSSLLIVEPETIISEWKEGINLAKQYKQKDSAGRCLYGTLTRMFDSLHIHSMEDEDGWGNWKDEVTIIPTDREAKLGMTYKEVVEFYSQSKSG